MILDLSQDTSRHDENSRRDELRERLRWLVNLRWLALAGVAVALVLANSLKMLESVWPLGLVAALMACLNTGFAMLQWRMPQPSLRALLAEALLQSTVDVIGLGLLIFFSGGLSNPFVFYFTFHVVIAGILLERKQAYIVAFLTTGVVFMLAVAEELGLNSRWELRGVLAEPDRTTLGRFGLVFTLGTTLVISGYLVTTIMDRLRGHSQDVRRLNAILAERVDMLAKAESKLAAEHHRARAILECMDEGVVVVDLEGRVLLANTAAQQSSLLALQDTLRQAGCESRDARAEGYCHGPLTGENLLKHHQESPPETAGPIPEAMTASADEQKAHAHCPKGTPASCLHEALLNGGHLCPATLTLLGAAPGAPKATLTPPTSPHLAQVEIQGRCFENTVSAVRSGLSGADGSETLGLVVVSRDVTSRKSLERQVIHAEKLTALGNLAAGVAHELNTPLGTILGYAQMVLEDDPASPRELRAIEEQARRCKKIVQGLLDFARKSGDGRDACAPNELASRIGDLMAHSLEMRNIALKLDLAEPPPPSVHVAVNEIEQVLVNLIANAADAIEMAPPRVAAESRVSGRISGGVALAVERTVTIQTRRDGNGVLIAVEDTGPGVPQDLAEQIFEPFFTTKEAGKGTGLGLSIARRIVEDHNGRLSLTRRLDGQPGARFEMRIERP